MVRWHLCTLDHLNTSGFGRPPPRHGLQLLFWFANRCVTFEPDKPANVMMLVLNCQPEKNIYGFHRFGNIEELLPVLSKPRKQKRKKTKLAYFEVGNLSTRTYPGSADLPAFVRECYGMHSSSNTDRIIISYQVKTRVVERVYVTEHSNKDLKGFRSDGTHEISPELIRVLQDPQLDLSTFLTLVGYYGDMEMLQDTEDREDMADMTVSYESVQMIIDTMLNDPCWFFSGAFRHRHDLTFNPAGFVQQDSFSPDLTFDPSGWVQQDSFSPDLTFDPSGWVQRDSFSPDLTFDPSGWVQRDSFSTNSSVGPVVEFSITKQKNKKSKPKKRQKVLRETYWYPRWELLYRAVDEEERRKKKRSGGDFSLLKILLGVGAIYLAAKCFSCLMRSCLNESSSDDGVLQVFSRIFPRRIPSFPQTHVMLDYVY